MDDGWFTPRDDLDDPAPPRRRWPWVAGVLTAVLIGGGIAIGAAARSERDKSDAEESAVRIEARKAEIRKIQAPQRGSATDLQPEDGALPSVVMKARARFVDRVEAAITKDARTRAVRGELRGDITETECGPVRRSPDAIPDHEVPGKPRGRYDCVAIIDDVANRQGGPSLGTYGIPYVTSMRFDRFTWVFCRNLPAQGEAGKSIFVRLDRSCTGATGRAIANGYIDDEPR